MFGKDNRKKHHPYATLAVFTLAASAVIGIVNKAKTFVSDKTDRLMSFLNIKKEEN